MSFLLANGHPEARAYSLGDLFLESSIVSERLNSEIVTDAILTQLAVASGFGSDKAGKEMKKILRELSPQDRVRRPASIENSESIGIVNPGDSGYDPEVAALTGKKDNGRPRR